jgi:hypothetical protein
MSSRFNPYRNSGFALEIDGVIQAGFSEVTIPDMSADPIEYREGNEIPTVRKIPGLIHIHLSPYLTIIIALPSEGK